MTTHGVKRDPDRKVRPTGDLPAERPDGPTGAGPVAGYMPVPVPGLLRDGPRIPDGTQPTPATGLPAVIRRHDVIGSGSGAAPDGVQESDDEQAATSKPRWTPAMGRYSPKDHRRPTLKNMTEPPSAIDRHFGIRTDPDARVSIFPEALPGRVAPPEGTTPQGVGHDLERALRDDLLGGSKYRESHRAGDKTRHGDVGAYETKAKTKLSSRDLDQVWRDLNNPTRQHMAHIIMQAISVDSANALARMTAMFEKLTGIRPHIAVREYATDPVSSAPSAASTP